MFSIKRILSLVFLIILGAAIFLFGGELAYQLKLQYVDQWKAEKVIEEFAQGWENLSKKGGTTPEETYNLFVLAIKNGDIDEAVSYCYPSHRDGCWMQLQHMKANNSFDEYMNNLPEWKELKITEEEPGVWEERITVRKTYYSDKSEIIKIPTGNGEFLEEVLPPGEYTSFFMTFEKNKHGIWQIESNL